MYTYFIINILYLLLILNNKQPVDLFGMIKYLWNCNTYKRSEQLSDFNFVTQI